MSHQAPAFVDEEYPIVIEVTNNDDRDMDVLVDVLLQPTEIDHTGGCMDTSACSTRNSFCGQ